MAVFLGIYKCEVCGNIVETVHAGGGDLVCCGQKMNKLEEKTADKTTEKHVPQIEKTDKGYKVTVGCVPHPMTAEHHIEWIELLIGDNLVLRKHLKPGDEPVAHFQTCPKCEGLPVVAREHCNIHGLWKS